MELILSNEDICRNNLDDVQALTEIAREYKISTDYHINEPPLLEQRNFKHFENNPSTSSPKTTRRSTP